MVTFHHCGGRVRFRVGVHIKGWLSYPMSGYLWNSEDEARKDVPLFIWLIERKCTDPKKPIAPDGYKWFQTLKPNGDWEGIRDFLSNRAIEVVVPSLAGASKHRRVSRRTHLDSYARRRVKKKTILVDVPTVLTPPVPRIDSSIPLLERQVEKQMASSLRRTWEEMGGANQTEEELRKVMTHMYRMEDNTNLIEDGVRVAYLLALEKKDEDSGVQILSLFILQDGATSKKLESIFNMSISARMYQRARNHASVYGCGQPVKNRLATPILPTDMVLSGGKHTFEAGDSLKNKKLKC